MVFDLKLYNVIVLGLSFMLVFTAFQTNGIIQQTVIKSIQSEDSSFTGDGYTSLAIIYAVFAAANWAAPSVVSLIGAKFTMIVGAATYGLFIASFLHPMTWSLYVASVIIGFGAACIWTGQGNFLTVNSDSDTIARNSGIFWALLQSSLLFGNLFVYFQFQGKDHIDKDTRFTVFIVLLSVACVGLLVMFALRSVRQTDIDKRIEQHLGDEPSGPVDAFVRSLRLFLTRDIMLLSVSFFFTGLELGFFSGVYGTAIGATKQLPSAKQYVGLNGIFIGIGEILGGATFGLFGKRTIRYGRDPIFLLGYVVSVVAYFLIFINIPDVAPLRETYDFAYIHSNAILALFCSFLLGFGDSCFNTQVYSILGSLFAEDSSAAFALFKFIQSLAAAASFFYSTTLTLSWQLLILTVSGTAGTVTFCLVEWKAYREHMHKVHSAVNDPMS